MVRSVKRSLPRRQPACLRVGKRRSRARVVRVKAMEGVESLECSPEEPPGVWGSERSEGGGGNWGGPTRPGGLRRLSSERRAL